MNLTEEKNKTSESLNPVLGPIAFKNMSKDFYSKTHRETFVATKDAIEQEHKNSAENLPAVGAAEVLISDL